MEKALEKIKEIIDFCDAVGCHRAIYESIKFVEKELEEAMKPKTCDGCYYEPLYDFELPCKTCKRNSADFYKKPKDNA